MIPFSETVSTLSRTTSERRIGERLIVLDAAERVDPAAAADAEADGALLERDHHEPRPRPEEERVVVVLGLRPALAEVLRVQPRRLPQVGDVEDRELRPERAPALLVDVLADAEQQVVADRMQVGGVAGDLQLAEHARLLRAARGRA